MSTEVLGYKHADIMIISKVKRSRRRRRQREAKRMDDMFHREDDHHVFVMLIHFPVFLKDLYLTNFLLFSRERWINLYLLSLHATYSNLLRFHLHNLGSIIIQILAIQMDRYSLIPKYVSIIKPINILRYLFQISTLWLLSFDIPHVLHTTYWCCESNSFRVR